MDADYLKITPLVGVTQVKRASRVIRRCWQETYRGILPEKQLRQLDERLWQRSLTRPGRANLIALVDGQLVGLVSYGAPRQVEYFANGGVN